MGEQFFDKYTSNVIGINKDFLNEFLADCDAEYLKVFIFLHWKGEKNQTIESIADFLNLTESDVIKAIKYWINHNVFDQNILNRLMNKKVNIIKVDSNILDTQNIIRINNNNTVNTMTNEDEIKKGVDFLVNQTEMLLQSPVTAQHEEFYTKLYTDYNFDKDMILKLIMYCIGLGPGKKSIKYMKAVADSWREEGVKNIDDIDAIIKVMNKPTNKVSVNKKTNQAVEEVMDKWNKKGFGI